MSANDTTRQQDALQLLKSDHAEVEQLFRLIDSLPEDDSLEEQVEGVVRELSVHAAIEEQVLYPAMRKALPDGDTLVQQAIDEHRHVKETLAAIERADAPGKRRRLLHELMVDVRHHVDEEETELFPKLQASLGRHEVRDMGTKLAAARKVAPTHPHPKAPNTPPGNIVAGAAAVVIDKARDALKRN